MIFSVKIGRARFEIWSTIDPALPTMLFEDVLSSEEA
jgi:hypothetical protein